MRFYTGFHKMNVLCSIFEAEITEGNLFPKNPSKQTPDTEYFPGINIS